MKPKSSSLTVIIKSIESANTSIAYFSKIHFRIVLLFASIISAVVFFMQYLSILDNYALFSECL